MSKRNGHFELPIRTARLVFEDEWAGAEVRVRLDVPLSMIFRFQELGDDAAKLRDAYAEFAESVLIGWNITIGGEEIPATADGLLRAPATFVAAVIREWIAATQRPLVTAES